MGLTDNNEIVKSEQRLQEEVAIAYAPAGGGGSTAGLAAVDTYSENSALYKEKQKRDKQAMQDAIQQSFQNQLDKLQGQINAARERMGEIESDLNSINAAVEAMENGTTFEEVAANDPNIRRILAEAQRRTGQEGEINDFQILNTLADQGVYSTDELGEWETYISNTELAQDRFSQMTLAEQNSSATAEVFDELNSDFKERMTISANMRDVEVGLVASGISQTGASELDDDFNKAETIRSPSFASAPQFDDLTMPSELSERISNRAITPDFMLASYGVPDDQPEFVQENLQPSTALTVEF